MDIPMDIKSMYFKDRSYNVQNLVKSHLMFVFFLQWRDVFVCKVCRMDDNEDWLGCEKCGQFFHASCLGVNFAEAIQDPFFYCPYHS